MTDFSASYRLGQPIRFAESPNCPPNKRGTGVIVAVPADWGQTYYVNRRKFDDGYSDPCAAQYTENELSSVPNPTPKHQEPPIT